MPLTTNPCNSTQPFNNQWMTIHSHVKELLHNHDPSSKKGRFSISDIVHQWIILGSIVTEVDRVFLGFLSQQGIMMFMRFYMSKVMG